MHHDLAHCVTNLEYIQTGARACQPTGRVLFGERNRVEEGTGVNAKFSARRKLGNVLTDNAAANQRFRETIAAKPVKAVHIPAGGFANGEQP